MGFLYSAFTENKPEAREWLEALGYEPLRFYQGKKWLYTGQSTMANVRRQWNEPYYATADYDLSVFLMERPDMVDCRGNFELFKAITAVRDDSDYMQYFKRLGSREESLYLCKAKKFNNIREFRHKSVNGSEYHSGLYKKATKEELIQHFKK